MRRTEKKPIVGRLLIDEDGVYRGVETIEYRPQYQEDSSDKDPLTGLMRLSNGLLAYPDDDADVDLVVLYLASMAVFAIGQLMEDVHQAAKWSSKDEVRDFLTFLSVDRAADWVAFADMQLAEVKRLQDGGELEEHRIWLCQDYPIFVGARNPTHAVLVDLLCNESFSDCPVNIGEWNPVDDDALYIRGDGTAEVATAKEWATGAMRNRMDLGENWSLDPGFFGFYPAESMSQYELRDALKFSRSPLRPVETSEKGLTFKSPDGRLFELSKDQLQAAVRILGGDVDVTWPGRGAWEQLITEDGR